MSLSLAEKLRRQLETPENLIIDFSDREQYTHDATFFSEVPRWLLMAESVDDIVTAVRFCREHQIPITPRGAGTGLSGGCVATRGALLLSTERFQSLEIFPQEKYAICGPGVITKELVDAAAPLGLTYPPDPASYEESTLGGNVAENAGGLRCKRYGVTKDYILGMEAVLTDGSVIKTGILNQNRGFSIGDILIGSEGILAIITSIALRLIDIPGQGNTILIAFNQPEDAAQTVTDITVSGLVPTIMEFLDGDAVACSNEYERTEDLDDAGALLLLETSDINAAEQTRLIRLFAQQNQCTCLRVESDCEKVENLWKVRRNLTNAAKAIAKLRLSEDVAVPNSKFPNLVAFVEKMNQNSELRINSYGHAGDGNLHVNFMAVEDTTEARQEMENQVKKLMRKAIDLGGTLSGEHGIGLAKRASLALEFDQPTLEAMRVFKAVFDPNYLLNPDKVFPE